MKALGRHLSFSNVAASLALFVALTTGIAFALENNSVKSKHVAPNTLKGSDINESTLGGVPALSFEELDVTADDLLATAGQGEMLGRIDNAFNGTGFASPVAQSTGNPTEANVVMGNSVQAMEASDIEVRSLSGALPTGTTRTFTLRAGSNIAGMADTALTCTIEEEEDFCSSTVAAGMGQLDDLLSIEITNTGSPGIQDYVFGYRLTPQGGVF